MRFPRSSGILLHPTSLPGPFGSGDFGGEAFDFVEFLYRAGQKLWQVLPVNPTGYGDSPYQSFSAFAGNPLLISLHALRERGYLSDTDLCNPPEFPEDDVDFGRVIPFRLALLRRAAQKCFVRGKDEDHAAYDAFCAANASWLDDFALFMALKSAHDGAVWTEWPSDLAMRRTAALSAWSRRLADEIAAHKYWQFEFRRQWSALQAQCHERGIRIVGDVPIYVAHDSADVWSHPELFALDARGRPTCQAGVPPDYFSATGQLWGNPIYRWDVLRESGYAWWVERFRSALSLYDIVRLDHFRGFEAYWEVPAGDTTAQNGCWIQGPGAELFIVLQKKLGPLPIVAENLGVITPEVEALRRQFDLPGMALLQFAFGTDPQAPSFRPHNYDRNLFAYTGGHDNDTAVGWWTGGVGDSTRTDEDVRREHEFARAYLGFDREPINWLLIRHVLASVADTAVIPLQDVLGLGSEARMNVPGTAAGNWRWRCRPGVLTGVLAARLRELTTMYDR